MGPLRLVVSSIVVQVCGGMSTTVYVTIAFPEAEKEIKNSSLILEKKSTLLP